MDFLEYRILRPVHKAHSTKIILRKFKLQPTHFYVLYEKINKRNKIE